jgi:regulator of sigma E protease
MKGDEIVAVNGVDLKVQVKEFKEILQEIPAETFPIKVSRSGELKEFSVTPVMVTEGGNKPERRINVQIRGALTMMKLGFSEAVDKSIDQNIENASLIVKVLGKLFIPVSYGGLPVKNLEGPLGIIRESGNAFELGFGNVLLVMAMISLNLGLLNLLPVPILDGGVMLLIAIEGVMGRELSMRVKERIVQVSFVALLTLTAFVLYNDVVKILPSSPPPQTAPAANP